MPFLGKTPTVGNFILLDSITVSNTATFALTKDSLDYYPGSAQNMIVSLNGVTQAPLTAYTITDNNIIFSSALDSDTDVIDYILVLGDTLNIGRPSDSTVGATQLQDYAVTSVKMSNTGVGAATYGTSTSIPQITIDAAGRITSATGIDRSNQFEDLTVTGNLTVSGNTVTVDAQTLSVEDPLIHLASNNETSDVVDIGFVGHYSNDGGTTKLHTGFFRDASDEKYYLFNGFEDATLDLSNPATTIDRTANTFTLAHLNVGGLNANGIFTIGDRGTATEELTIFHEDNVSYLISDSSAGGGAKGEFSFRTNDGGTAAERVRIDGDGNVGIGTNVPNRKLTINQTPPTALGSPMLQVGEATFVASGYYGIGLGYTAASYTNPPTEIAAVSTSSSGGTTADIVFGTRSVTTNTAATERMRITSAGKVGIGTNSPDSNLHIYHTGQPPISGAIYANVILGTDSTTNYQRIRYDVGGTPYWGLTREGTSNDFILSGRIGSSWSDTVLIAKQTTGNIGIGISPSYRLHVYNSSNDAPMLIDTGNVNGAHLRFGSSSAIKHYIGCGGGIGLGDHEDLTMRAYDNIWFAAGNSSTARMRISNTGKVGIGTGGNGLSADFTLMSNASDWPMIFYNTVTGGEYFYAGPTNNNFGSGGGKFVISDDNSSVNAFFQYQKSTQHLWLGSYNVKNEHRTILAGKGVESSGVNYGSYGQLEFYANNNYTGSAHRWLLTNAIRANVFGIIRSTDATTSASIGAFGAVTNGTTDFAIDGDGRIGMGTEVPQTGTRLEVVHTNLSAEPYSGIVVKNTSTSGTYYTGVTADAVGQAHFRFALNGALKWQWRVGNGTGVDRMDLYSWTAGKDVLTIHTDGRLVTNNYSFNSVDGVEIYGATGRIFTGINYNSYGAEIFLVNNRITNGVCSILQYRTNGTTHGSIYANSSGLSFNNTSDYRIKSNVAEITGSLDKIASLRPVSYNLYDLEETNTGFIAHEVQEIFPEMVYGEKDAVDEEGEAIMQSLNMGVDMTAHLVAAIKELKARIEVLESA